MNSKNRVREVQWQQRTEDLAILWHELHLTLQLGMQALTRKNKPKRERERDSPGEETRPGVSTGGDQISALPQERSRAVSYPSGFKGVSGLRVPQGPGDPDSVIGYYYLPVAVPPTGIDVIPNGRNGSTRACSGL